MISNAQASLSLMESQPQVVHNEQIALPSLHMSYPPKASEGLYQSQRQQRIENRNQGMVGSRNFKAPMRTVTGSMNNKVTHSDPSINPENNEKDRIVMPSSFEL